MVGGPERQPGTRTHFLDLLEPPDRAFLEARGRRTEYHKDALLFRRGEPAGRLIVILAGLVKVSSTTAAGSEMVLAIRGAGDVLGELSSIDSRLRSATVTALNPVTALVLEAPLFEDLLRRPSVGRTLLAVVVHRLREADAWRLHGKATVTERVAILLDGLVEYGHRRAGRVVLDMELSQQDLASAVGASRTAVNRSLRELRDQRILTTERQQVTILRPELLRRIGD